MSQRATFERPARPVKADTVQGDVQVTIKSLKSGQWTVNVSSQGTIADLKQALQTEAGIQANTQRLVLKGKALVDNKTLSEYGLSSGSVVHLFAKAGASIPAAGSSAASETTTESSPAKTLPTAAASPSPSIGQESGSGTSTPSHRRPVLTTFRGLSEASTEVAKNAEFWYWLNDQLKEQLGSKDDAATMVKGFLGQYRDLVGNAGTKEIENTLKK
ncbi:hypothetical protein BGW38_003615 [Lunasporangiospora selenospora]|uniref:Ubiquitin-like domain-containing protein n=1 Tax=Lunasporangiospora selenospora TaxID=979761 RepID=A0A9P6FQS1_9FUNG|nr:hypothetical protein BGW38_003615 [Lunasporangiospora selenospora]